MVLDISAAYSSLHTVAAALKQLTPCSHIYERVWARVGARVGFPFLELPLVLPFELRCPTRVSQLHLGTCYLLREALQHVTVQQWFWQECLVSSECFSGVKLHVLHSVL